MYSSTLTPPDIKFPSTRFQGSKVKLLPWILETLAPLQFETVLDAFGGTGCFAYAMKQQGKQVTYNDALSYNALMASGLIANNQTRITPQTLQQLLDIDISAHTSGWLSETFRDIYYTDTENAWIEGMVQNIRQLESPAQQGLGYFALFQSCLVKRPFNLFHRKNLYIRFADTQRSFGNKTTWDTPFETHFEKFIAEANAAVFDNGRSHTILNDDVLAIPGTYDLVYLDPPYISEKGQGVDYHGFYHFLEGLARFDDWPAQVDFNSKHRRLKPVYSPWTDKKTIENAFLQVFEKFSDSIIVVSYRSDGIPSVERLAELLQSVKSSVIVERRKPYKYALSDKKTEEILLIGS